jgi:hypothetical protein
MLTKLINRVVVGLFIWLACVLADALSLTWMLAALVGSPGRFWRSAIAKDQAANAAILNGNEDETISSRAARASARGERWGCVLCRFLNVFDKDHCKKAVGT